MNKNLLKCSKCGKKLIERKSNGFFHFRFGSYYSEYIEKGKSVKRPVIDNNGDVLPVVDMMIHGSIKIKCFKKDCRHDNLFTFLPNESDFSNTNQK